MVSTPTASPPPGGPIRGAERTRRRCSHPDRAPDTGAHPTQRRRARARPDAPRRPAHAATTVDGRRIGVGDTDHPFTIQSISKLLVYGLALETHGRDRVLERVGVAPTGDRFNAIALDGDRAPNPMVDRAVWESERATGNRNRAIAYLMLSQGIVDDQVEETLDLYFARCSVLVTADDLATIGATIANHGVHPDTGEQVVDPAVTRDMLTVALTCGMYDYAGEWAFTVGIPAKSRVGGGILGLLPGVGGIATYSPRLDEYGNSVRGVRVFEALSGRFDLHLFDPDRPWVRTAP